jgi:cellulose synthase/poly-beta-1,6-N-acetylglucosamine synthase-like glycosyltransferase
VAILFWTSIALVAYVYAGYPLLLHLWSRVWPRPLVLRRPPEPPGVSIVIAARNEGCRLGTRIENLLEMDYPAAARQIIVVSDGSTDDTLDVLRRYAPDVDVVAAGPGGKALALNAGVERARFELLVFADSRQGFARDALAWLVAPFGDPRVGAVSGELVLDGESRDRRSPAGDRRHALHAAIDGLDRRRFFGRRVARCSTIADGVGLYWRYEKQIRRDESAVGSMVGVTGAIYAMRRSLWRPLPADTILDDVLVPMRCVMAGRRVVFEERARGFDRVAADAGAEARRKRRTLAGNYQLCWLEPRLLLPWRNPAWLQFVSHKLARLIVPYALALLLAASLILSRESVPYRVALAGEIAFAALAAYGAWLERRGSRPGWAAAVPRAVDRAARVALMFLVMNGAAVAGLVATLTRRKVWQ